MTGPQSGAIIGGRLRLERALSGDAANQLWLVTDLRNRATHAVEFLPTGSARCEHLVHPRHPNLLAFYRCERAGSEVAAVTAYHAGLDEPALGINLEALNVAASVALKWLSGIAEALAALHEAGLPAHGAIRPSRVRVGSGGDALLTGYPYAADTDGKVDETFLSPQRRAGAAPDVSDDVYGWAALAYFLLSGGERPPEVNESIAAQPFAVEELRQARRLTPTGWLAHWEQPLQSALSVTPSMRPASLRVLLDALRQSTGQVLSASDVPVARPVTRRPPSWRLAKAGPFAVEARDSGAAAGGLLQTLVDVRADTATLQLLRMELDRRQEGMLADMQQTQAARAEAGRMSQHVAAESAALAKARSELAAQATALAEQRASLQSAKETVEQKRAGEQAQAEKQAQQEAKNLARERTRLEQEARALQVQQQSLETRAAQLADATQQAERKSRELEERMTALAASERALTELCGSSDPAEWKRFASRVPTTKTKRHFSPVDPEAIEAPKPEFAAATVPVSAPVLATAPAFAPGAGPTPAPALDAVPASSETAPLLEVSASVDAVRPLRATLGLPNGRRLHLFAGPVLRFGRHGESDFLLVALMRGQNPNLALVREISRKHFELHISPTGIRLIDGWSGEAKPSQHGVCIDGRRVTPDGADVRPGCIISVTTRAPSRTVPHWKVLSWSGGPREESAPSRGSDSRHAFPSTSPMSAVFLQRLDDAPDDICVIFQSVRLRDLGVTEPELMNIELAVTPNGFAQIQGSRQTLLQDGLSPHPSITLVSLGSLSPFASAPGVA